MVKATIKHKSKIEPRRKTLKKPTLKKPILKKPMYNFSYILSHSGIITGDYKKINNGIPHYKIQVPKNIRLIQYTPKGETINSIDVLYLFNRFNNAPSKKGIIENPRYFSLNNGEIYESNLELTITEPGEKTNNLFLHYTQTLQNDVFFDYLINHRENLPFIKNILNEKKDSIKNYLPLRLFECTKNKTYDLEKLGNNADNVLDDLLNNLKLGGSNDEFNDYFLYNTTDKNKKRFTLENILFGLSRYYEKHHPRKIFNFVQLGCNIEIENNQMLSNNTQNLNSYIKNEKEKEYGQFDISEFKEIQKRHENNKNKNILTIKNLVDNIINGVMYSKPSELEHYYERNNISPMMISM